MNDPIQERMDALTAANLRLLRRVDALERRLAELEGQKARVPDAIVQEPVTREPLPAEQAAPQPVPMMEAAFLNEPAAVPDPDVQHEAEQEIPTRDTTAAPEPARESLESTVGLNWVNRIGAVTLVLGVAFFFKYAVDNEWIGPTGRILLGVLAGALLCGFGYRSWVGRQSVFAQGVTASGVAVLYLSFYASFSLYQLTPAALAFALMVAVTLMGGGFAWLYGAQAIAVLSYLAGVATPFLLSTGEYHPWVLTLYLFALNAGWLTFARRMRWWLMEPIAAAAVILPFEPFYLGLHAADRGAVTTAWVLLQYGVFALSPLVLLTGLAQVLGSIAVGAAWAGNTGWGFVVLLPLMGAGFWLSEVRQRRFLPGLALGAFTAGYLLLRAEAENPLPLMTLFLGVSSAFAIALGYTLWRYHREERPDVADLMLLVGPGALYFLEGYELLTTGAGAWRGVFSACVAAVYMVMGWRVHRESESRAEYDPRAIVFCVGMGLTLATVAVAVQFAGFRITMIWALEAAALAWLCAKYEQKLLAWAVLALTVLVAVRLTAIDAPAYLDRTDLTLLANPRFLTHIVAAVALAGAAWWLRPRMHALLPYLAAHGALLHGLAWENYTWVLQTTPPEGRTSAISIGLTILGAVYGLALVVAGVLQRFQLNRLLGLALLAMVVAKLYLADVWSMERIHRILAFGALGLLLLATSFFYSRFRTKIEVWMKDDDTNPHIS